MLPKGVSHWIVTGNNFVKAHLCLLVLSVIEGEGLKCPNIIVPKIYIYYYIL